MADISGKSDVLPDDAKGFAISRGNPCWIFV
jgi:hypothetical protein